MALLRDHPIGLRRQELVGKDLVRCRRLRQAEGFRHELDRAREAIEDDLAAPWTLVTMAQAAMMAPHHFHRCFRVAFGETPRSWLARRRAERAMALLRSTRRPVLEICLAVGYASPSSFTASFTARYGTAPSQVVRPLRVLE